MTKFLHLASFAASYRLLTKEQSMSSDEGRSPLLADFYHTTDEIAERVRSLQNSCGVSLSVTTRSEGDVSIDVATVKKENAAVKNKFFLLFGEHARELISPESALHLVENLCDSSNEKAQAALDHTEFRMILNGNPRSRKRVEAGDFCLRVNPNGVDLNRNWDEKWAPNPVNTVSAVDTNPGSGPFSEPETRIFRDVIDGYKPTSFLTIHSGTRGMYMPWAFDMEHLADRNEKSMMQILKNLDKDYCKCPFGAAGKEVGYSCPGTCLDYVYDKLKTPYAFAFEIYTDESADFLLEDRYDEKLREAQSDFFFFQEGQTRERNINAFADGTECFPQYNPSTEESFKKTLDTWTNVYLDMAGQITERLDSSAQQDNSPELGSL